MSSPSIATALGPSIEAAATELPAEFSEVVLAIYGSLHDVPPWQRSLDALCHYLHVANAGLALRPPSSNDLGFVAVSVAGSVRWSAETQKLARAITLEYQADLYRQDPFVDLPPGVVMTAEEAVGRKQWLSSWFYQAILAKNGITHAMGVNISTDAGTACRLRVYRRAEQPLFCAADKVRLGRLVPHFEQALNLYSRFDRHESERDLYVATLGRMHISIFVLDESEQVIHTNASADRLLDVGDGIRLVSGHLQASDEGGRLELQRVLRSAAANPSAVFGATLARPLGGRRLALVVHKIPLRPTSEGKARAAWAIFARDPDAANDMDMRVVQQLFNLTPAEALLAVDLMNGQSLDEAAESLGIRRNTARAQLRSIFAKCGVNRQTELVRVLLSGMVELSNPAC